MYGYVYLTTNLVNGKKYIGQHRASKFTENYKGSGKIVKRAFIKYGWDNFKVEIIEECQSKEELDQKEIYWIDYYNAVNSEDFYNMARGGSNGALVLAQEAARQPEVRSKAALKIMETRRNKYNGDAAPWFHSKEVVAKRVQTRKDRYGDAAYSLHTEESQKKAVQARIDKYGSPTAHMMTKEVREEVSKKVSSVLEFEGIQFTGYRSLRDYIYETKGDYLSLTAVRRLSYGSFVNKYPDYYQKIKIISYGSVMRGKLSEYDDGNIPVAED